MSQAWDWRKSTRCESGMCVEVGRDGRDILVRDGKNPDGPVLRFSAEEWRVFAAGMKAGEFDA